MATWWPGVRRVRRPSRVTSRVARSGAAAMAKPQVAAVRMPTYVAMRAITSRTTASPGLALGSEQPSHLLLKRQEEPPVR